MSIESTAPSRTSTDLIFRTTNVSALEIAAVTAVLAVGDAQDSSSGLAAAAQDGRSAVASDGWTRSTRALRVPLEPGPRAWRSFRVS